ncbi:hypothetical protein L195_g025002 [Trifolium pratense]|uniref:Uncharacterized protein n=1 Tax=Trifolium pratense TaxID=57577 RepID=A0A2K3NF95_TRIPR|nr:hypothetical protein L195_g025002 [Trifolium pratense]
MSVNKTVPPEQTDRQRYKTVPSLIADVETTVELVLKISQCNINVNPQKIRFPVVVVDCSCVGFLLIF